MKEFKVGDLVFEVSVNSGIYLSKVKESRNPYYELGTGNGTYKTNGRLCSSDRLPSLFHTTPENRQALVALYGEDEVPNLPLLGSDLTRKLLERQEYVLCYCADRSDDEARKNKVIQLVNDWREDGFFRTQLSFRNSGTYPYAVPIDMNANEITELED